MADKVISARFILRDTKKTEDAVIRIFQELEKVFGMLQKIQSSNAFTQLGPKAKSFTADLAKIRQEAEKINKELKQIGGQRLPSTGSGGGRPASAPRSTPSPSAPSNTPTIPAGQYTAVIKALEDLIKRQQDWNKEVGGTATALRVLNRELKEGVGRADEDYEELISTTARLKAEQKEVTDEVRRQQRAFEAAKTGQDSYRQINNRLVELRRTFKELSADDRKGPIGRETLKEIQKLDKELKSIDASMGQYQRNVGNYKSAFQGLGKVLSAVGIAGGLADAAREAIRTNAELSDSIAFVQRTTGLAREEVEELYDAVRARIDAGATRSSIEDQLGIAKIGGRLGVAKDELLGFIDVIDQAGIALGDELEGGIEGIATDLQKLNQVLEVEGDKGTAGGIKAIGSAINELGKAGPASASFLVGFAKRLGGIAPSAKISASDLFALGATLDELGQTQEVAGTSISKLIVALGDDVPRFAKLAGTSIEAFSETLSTNGTEALLQVLQGAGKVEGGVEQLASTLADFGIDSARAASVIGVLVNNTELLEEKIELSAKSFEEATSLTKEYELANATLGAEFDKLTNVALNFVTGIGVQNFLTSVVQGVRTFIGVLKEVPTFIEENKVALGLLGAALIAFNAQLIVDTAAVVANAAAKKIYTVATGIATGATNTFTAALLANPIGAIIGLVLALAAGIFFLVKNFDQVREAIVNAYNRVVEFSEGSGILNKAVKALIAPIRLVVGVFQNWDAIVETVRQAFVNLYERMLAFSQGTGFLNKVVGGLVKQIQAAAFVVQNWAAIWEGLKAAVSQVITNIVNDFKFLLNEAEIVNLQLGKLLTFDDAEVLNIDNQIEALREANKRIAEEAKTGGQAFAEAFTAERRRIMEEEAKTPLPSPPIEAPADPTTSTPDAPTDQGEAGLTTEQRNRIELYRKYVDERRGLTLKLNQEEEKDLQAALDKEAKIRAREQEKLAKEEEKATKERIEREIAAAKTIRDLKTELIEDDLARNIAQAENTAADDIEGFEGTDEQIAAQTELRKEQLRQQIQELEKTAEEERIAALDAFEKQVGGAITEAYANLTTEELKAEGDRLAKKLEAQRAGQELELAQIRSDFTNRQLLIEEQLANGQISEEEYREELRLLDEERKLEELEAEKAFLEEKAALIEGISADNLLLQQQIADAEVKIAAEKNRQILENEKRTNKQRQELSKLQVGALESLIDSTESILGRDEENRKKYGGILKALALGEVAINLARELSAINANPIVNADLTQGTRILLTAAAVGRAVAATVKIATQDFEYGGALTDSSSEGNSGPVSRSSSPDSPSTFVGISHGLGSGRPAPDAPININPSNLTTPISIPASPPKPGMVKGPTHKDGGVKVISDHGAVKEIEGGEFWIQNGPEVYIINRKSVAAKRPQLEAMAADAPEVYKPERRVQASAINSYRGYGIAFEAGGVLAGVTPATSPASQVVAPLSAPRLSDPTAVNEQIGSLVSAVEMQGNQIAQVARELQDSNETINSRIDRFVVTADPLDLLEKGIEQREARNENSL